jgi:hypothetical protein
MIRKKLLAWIVAGVVAAGAAGSGVTYAVVISDRDTVTVVMSEEVTTAAPSQTIQTPATVPTSKSSTAHNTVATKAVTISKKAPTTAIADTTTTRAITTTKKESMTVTTEKSYPEYARFEIAPPIRIDLGADGYIAIDLATKGPGGFALRYSGRLARRLTFISMTDTEGRVMPDGDPVTLNYGWPLRPPYTDPLHDVVPGGIVGETTDFAALSTVIVTYQLEGAEPASFTVNLPF